MSGDGADPRARRRPRRGLRSSRSRTGGHTGMDRIKNASGTQFLNLLRPQGLSNVYEPGGLAGLVQKRVRRGPPRTDNRLDLPIAARTMGKNKRTHFCWAGQPSKPVWSCPVLQILDKAPDSAIQISSPRPRRFLRGLPSPVKGAGLRTLSLRSSRVRIPPPAHG